MQINRLFEIIYILLDKQIITAKELADRFEVSTRTIYRDIEILSGGGVPIYMKKGKGGGIRLLPNYILNKSILTNEEKNNILMALHNLKVTEDNSIDAVITKLNLLFGENNTNYIEVDYSDWGSSIKEQFETVKLSILSRKVLSFDYISSQGNETKRIVEPYMLWFKEKTWYLKCFCLKKQDFRTFRISRMRNVIRTDETYISRDIIIKNEEYLHYNYETKVILKIDASQKYRIYDDFLDKDTIQNADGSYTVTMNFVEDEWLYGYILSFGNYATVLEPNRIRNIIKERLIKSWKNYL